MKTRLDSMFEKVRIKHATNVKLTSGKKTNIFYDFDMWSAGEWEYASQMLGLQIKETFDDFQYIIAPAVGGVIVGHEIAKQLNKPLFIYNPKDQHKFRPYCPVDAPFVIVDDVTSSFKTVNQILTSVSQENLVGVASLLHRGGASVPYGLVTLRYGEVEK